MQCRQWRPPKKQKSVLCVLHCYMTSFWKHVAVCCSITQSCPTLWDPMNSNTPGFPVLHHLLEFAQTHVHWVSDTIQPFCPLSTLLLLPSIFPSIRVFSNESVLYIKWPKYWSFSFSWKYELTSKSKKTLQVMKIILALKEVKIL